MITAFWNKYFTALSIILFGLSLSAQSEIEGERLRLFNEQFFAAENAKNRDQWDKALVLFETLHQKDPENALVNYELAQLYARNEDQQKAIYHAEKAHEVSVDNIWYLRLRLAVYEQFGLRSMVVETLENALKRNPQNQDFQFQIAEAYYREGEFEKALSALDAIEQESGINAQISNQKKSIYLEMGDLEGASSEMKKLIAEYPRNMEYRGSLGQLYQANGLEEEAYQQYMKMLEIDSLDPRPHLDLANYYQLKGAFYKSLFHLQKAMSSKQLDMERKIAVLLSLFEASSKDSMLTSKSFELLDDIIAQEPEDPRIYAMYGDYLSRDGRDIEAVQFYKKALEYGEKFQIWEQILLIEMQNRQFESLRTDAPQALKSFPNQPLPYLLAGIAYHESENAEMARDYLEDGLAFVFNNARLQSEFYLQLGAVHHQLKDHRESDYYFEEVLKINPNHAGALNNFAYYLSLRDARLDDALKMSQKANAISPSNPIYLDTQAWVLHRLDRHEEALKIVEGALALLAMPEAEILEHYGDILKALGRDTAAKEQYQKALSLEASEILRTKIKALP